MSINARYDGEDRAGSPIHIRARARAKSATFGTLQRRKIRGVFDVIFHMSWTIPHPTTTEHQHSLVKATTKVMRHRTHSFVIAKQLFLGQAVKL
jgi:hypothetical protein